MNKKKVIIIGSGLAALTVAERLCQHCHVIILTKSNKDHSNSIKAQGGIAASVSQTDHWKIHYQDTMMAGCFYNNQMAVNVLVEKGPLYINKLMEQGLEFDRDRNGDLLLGKEGAHQKRRILHAGGDATGKVVMNFMKKQIDGKVTIIEHEVVLDLVIENNTCIGVITSNSHEQLTTYYADHIVLATGGCGGLYQVTSNDPSVVGDGLAMAYRAGASLSDLEFIQFHPTMLYLNNRNYGLVSEAVRGEGAILVNDVGKLVMKDTHPLKDLAPRDVVARAIQTEMTNGKTVFLDISMIENFSMKFPTISSLCEQANIDVDTGLIPVAPGAHFLMGGVVTNQVGETTVDGLYAIGEVACTGVHGANRLASNSLLEGIVFSNLLADQILLTPTDVSVYRKTNAMDKKTYTPVGPLPNLAEIQEVMQIHVGIERTKQGLLDAKSWIEQYDFRSYRDALINNYTPIQIRTVNMLTTCWLIITSALKRTESRGAHYRNDYPLINDHEWRNKQIIRKRLETEPRKMTGVGQ
ncbi:L-aspartate oxidase [Aquibacillus rhizosphaerae]|uniref:L-aspartate oxidase n=1 Tax=Aquibacillus rhizosphaerae TaxID=3051431 RepID=UPI0038B3C7B5